MPQDPCGQTHYLEGCLCIYCRNFYKCRVFRVELKELSKLLNEWYKKAFGKNNKNIDYKEAKMFLVNSTVAREVLKKLLEKPLTVRELSIELNRSANYVWKVIKRLEDLGLVIRNIAIILEATRMTSGNFTTTLEKVWRYTVTDKDLVKKLLKEAEEELEKHYLKGRSIV